MSNGRKAYIWALIAILYIVIAILSGAQRDRTEAIINNLAALCIGFSAAKLMYHLTLHTKGL